MLLFILKTFGKLENKNVKNVKTWQEFKKQNFFTSMVRAINSKKKVEKVQSWQKHSL